ncbi:hypothetical protein C7B61_11930, partial [filamentous cyanobacterium CCP1]
MSAAFFKQNRCNFAELLWAQFQFIKLLWWRSAKTVPAGEFCSNSVLSALPVKGFLTLSLPMLKIPKKQRWDAPPLFFGNFKHGKRKCEKAFYRQG